jgi:hypothetical protein
MMQERRTKMIATAALWLTAMSLAFASSASADTAGTRENAADHKYQTAEPNDQAAAGNPGVHQTVTPTEVGAPILWPWPQLEPGHDKCKRRKAWPLPLWCFGLSSWPVMKAVAVNATVHGIHAGPNALPPSVAKDAPEH